MRTTEKWMITMDLRNKRRMASEILGVGKTRVWIDPMKEAEVAGAITKNDIRRLISQGVIKAPPKRGISMSRAKILKLQKKKGRSRGHGRRTGVRSARTPRKEAWMKAIRAARAVLVEYRESKKISPAEYRRLYNMADSGLFKTKAYLKLYIQKMKEKSA